MRRVMEIRDYEIKRKTKWWEAYGLDHDPGMAHCYGTDFQSLQRHPNTYDPLQRALWGKCLSEIETRVRRDENIPDIA
jgi:hypothetical protein